MDNEYKPLSAAEIERLRELEAKATQGEWETDETYLVWSDLRGEYVANTRVEDFDTIVRAECESNAALIAAMRNALPRLLAMLQPPTGRLSRWTRRGKTGLGLVDEIPHSPTSAGPDPYGFLH